MRQDVCNTRYFPQIVHTWMFGETPLNMVLQMLKSSGFDGLDLSMHMVGRDTPENFLLTDLQRTVSNEGLEVYAVTPLYDSLELNLCDNNILIRKKALEFSKLCIEATAHIGCDRMLVSPSCISVNYSYGDTYRDDWARAVESIYQLGEYASGYNVILMLEPINRYRTAILHTVGEALKFIGEVGLHNIHVVADVYHMHMEEANGIPNAIIECGSHLKCLHIGDNTRKPPGMGALNWWMIIKALYDIRFQGPLSFEPVSLYFDKRRMVDPKYLKAFIQSIRTGREYLETLLRSAAPLKLN